MTGHAPNNNLSMKRENDEKKKMSNYWESFESIWNFIFNVFVEYVM